MKLWLIEPRDPLIVRDGRPFGPDPGARATSLPFPLPSTTTGAFRARLGAHLGGDFTRQELIDQLRATRVRGPLLVELDDESRVVNWLLPAPADALLLKQETPAQHVCRRLLPLEPFPGTLTDYAAEKLSMVAPVVYAPDKVAPDTPTFWYWEQMQPWLHDPPDEQTLQPTTLGHRGPSAEQRMHVSVYAATGTADEGMLFQTSGLVFTHRSGSSAQTSLTSSRRLALALFAEAEFAPQLAPMGGERRLMHWYPAVDDAATPLPATCPEPIRALIRTKRACRVVLVTPAMFEAGFRPAWLLAAHAGLTATLAAAVVARPQVMSGWDLLADNGPRSRGKPKPTRRLAPAGSVYFLTLPDATQGDDAAIDAWIDAIWLQCVSDAAQDRADGFGLALLGGWSGTLRTMKIQEQSNADTSS
ncbi:type III-B CRISPR module-associated protein Cmr3 [Candidatus Chloroploca sp. Khr17]|uniref:type III-B CRISPR module-associated protein Cmr3 n=1 Tax=Candidatus Chloroploca sp. Khr17 TaxID=2496869 RepID=UPI00101D710D|nr:type III-B CRISPR module-associated protein Cmr3 [Candidatus Chloroploca sp. Khr17]